MSVFALHPRLAADTHAVTDWPLCRVLLMNDARFPWLVLVPRRPGATEFYDLDANARALAAEEIARAARALKQLTGADKINLGALGNLVPQLHLHVVARRMTDAAWPGPVWGAGSAIPYLDLKAEAERLRAALEAGTAVAR
jgi:diadenosine tetraphosphate (Ap4A) HIT family hydrolase